MIRHALTLRASGLALLGLALVLAPSAARAQDRVQEKKQVLEQLCAVLETTGRHDGHTAAKALRDPSWAVRALATVRLSVLGLHKDAARALHDAARPGTKPLAEKDPALEAADALAAKTSLQDADPSADKITIDDEGIRSYVSLLHEELQVGKADARALRDAVLDLPDLAEAAGTERAKEFVARKLLTLVDRPAVLAELECKTVHEAVRESGQRVFAWFRANGKFLYLHPREHALRLDGDARLAGQGTDAYREKNPWLEGQGPGAPVEPGKRESRSVK